jgi:hypothetical protein
MRPDCVTSFDGEFDLSRSLPPPPHRRRRRPKSTPSRKITNIE